MPRREEQSVTLDLSSTTNHRSRSDVIAVPAWATRCSVFLEASGGWGSTPATVEIKAGRTGATRHVSFATPCTFSADGRQADLLVDQVPELVALVTSAASGGSIDTDAVCTFVFSDAPF